MPKPMNELLYAINDGGNSGLIPGLGNTNLCLNLFPRFYQCLGFSQSCMGPLRL